MTTQPYPEPRPPQQPYKEYEVWGGLSLGELRSIVKEWAAAGWIIQSNGTGYNGYFWLIMERNVP